MEALLRKMACDLRHPMWVLATLYRIPVTHTCISMGCAQGRMKWKTSEKKQTQKHKSNAPFLVCLIPVSHLCISTECTQVWNKRRASQSKLQKHKSNAPFLVCLIPVSHLCISTECTQVWNKRRASQSKLKKQIEIYDKTQGHRALFGVSHSCISYTYLNEICPNMKYKKG